MGPTPVRSDSNPPSEAPLLRLDSLAHRARLSDHTRLHLDSKFLRSHTVSHLPKQETGEETEGHFEVLRKESFRLGDGGAELFEQMLAAAAVVVGLFGDDAGGVEISAGKVVAGAEGLGSNNRLLAGAASPFLVVPRA